MCCESCCENLDGVQKLENELSDLEDRLEVEADNNNFGFMSATVLNLVEQVGEITIKSEPGFGLVVVVCGSVWSLDSFRKYIKNHEEAFVKRIENYQKEITDNLAKSSAG